MESLKCNSLLGAIIALTVTCLPTSSLETGPYRADNGNLEKFGAIYPHGTVFALRQCLYQNEAMGMESLQM